MLLGREEQFARLEALLTAAISANQSTTANNGGGGKRKKRTKNGGTTTEDGSEICGEQWPIKPLSIYVDGSPGTGKTATVQAVIKKLNWQRKEFHFVSVDCTTSSTATNLSRKILSELGYRGTVSASQAGKALAERFTNTDRPILILLDEVDHLVAGRRSELLYTVFGWPAQYHGRIIVIGIANTLGLTNRQLPMLKALGTAPELITFPAYTSAQIVAILEQRLATECPDRRAIELCAKKVASLTGDVRRALDIALQTLANLKDAEEEEEGRMMEPKLIRGPQKETTPIKRKMEEGEEGAGENGTTPKKLNKEDSVVEMTTPKRDANACREVLKVINKTMSSPCHRSKLPAQTRTLLATLLRLITSSSTSSDLTPSKCITSSPSIFRTPSKTPNGKSSVFRTPSKTDYSGPFPIISRDRLFGAFVTVCEHLKLPAPCPDEVDEMLGQLESQSMVKVKSGGGGANNRISTCSRILLSVEMRVARASINDNALIADIEQLALL